ncbi:MAG: phosphoribosylanthranilate isomerase [Pirellulaceae bacterium]|nr:phosphoribosylanthranilate isomerase [Pirellulaceae bacterium]
MFRIKICGITNPNDALMVADSHADAIGLNFYPESPRYVSPEKGNEIVSALQTARPDKRLDLVGVVVNPTEKTLHKYLERIPLDYLQFHGDETAQQIASLQPLLKRYRCKHIKAFRIPNGDTTKISSYLLLSKELTSYSDAILVDAFDENNYGGTGRRVDWESLDNAEKRTDWPPLILAGGLTAENITEAITTVTPAAVDTASGVEKNATSKDQNLVLSFSKRAAQAFRRQ